MKFALTLSLILLCVSPARAGLTESELKSVEFAPSPNARIPPDLVFKDTNGRETTLAQAMAHRPTLLLPVDYGCRTTCGPALSILSSALTRTGISPGEEFRLVIIGLDSRSTAGEARAFTEAQIGDPKLLASTSVLTGSADVIRSLTEAIGYKYVPDNENRAFAHPTGLVALTPDGRVARALSSLGLTATDLRLALTEASEGRIGGIFGRLSLICYGFDAVHGIYTNVVERLLMITALATLVLIAGAIAAMNSITKRRRASS